MEIWTSVTCVVPPNHSSATFLSVGSFDTVGWFIRPVKTVGHITYIVLVQTLNHAQSINQSKTCGFNLSANFDVNSNNVLHLILNGQCRNFSSLLHVVLVVNNFR